MTAWKDMVGHTAPIDTGAHTRTPQHEASKQTWVGNVQVGPQGPNDAQGVVPSTHKPKPFVVVPHTQTEFDEQAVKVVQFAAGHATKEEIIKSFRK